MKVIINADDFGMTQGVNEGILDAHLNGAVTRTTLIMNGYAVEEAVEMAKNCPSLKVGLHLALSFGTPLSKTNIDAIVDEHGLFKFTSIESDLTSKQIIQIKLEWEKQIQAFLNTGLSLDHLDSHHHVHGWKDLKDVVIDLAKRYDIPIRYTETLKNHKDHLLTEYLWLDFYKEGVNENLYKDLIRLPYESVEVMTHPAIVDEELLKCSSYTKWREKETELLKSIKPSSLLTLI